MKNIFKLTIVIVLSILLLSCGKSTGLSAGLGGGKDKDVTIFVASDIHYIAKEMYDEGPAFQKYMKGANGRNFLYIDEVVRAFAAEIEEQKSTALIICGDLTNNGEKINHQKLAKRLKDLETASGTKVYVIPGNHDVENPWARRFQGDDMVKVDSVSPEEFTKIYGDFGFNEAISRDEYTLSYLVELTDSLWVIMLDTNLYGLNAETGTPTVGGALMVDTLEWMEECAEMAKDKGAEIITASHHNLLKHSENRYFGYTIGQNERAVSVYERLGIALNLSGHIHAQSAVSHEYEGGALYDIATGTMSSFPTRYAVLKYLPKKHFSYDTFSVNVEKWAEKEGLNDENLLRFNDYSKQLYVSEIYDRYYNNLQKENLYSEYEMTEMAKTMSLISAVRFAGFRPNDDHLIVEIENTPGYEIWKKYDSEFSNLLKFKNADTIFVKQNI